MTKEELAVAATFLVAEVRKEIAGRMSALSPSSCGYGKKMPFKNMVDKAAKGCAQKLEQDGVKRQVLKTN
jgi:hypothetical protein